MAMDDSLPLAVTRLVKLLSMSLSKKLPLRAIFKVWRELGLPDNFEDSVISSNSDIFLLQDGNEPNTHFGFPPGMRLKKNFKAKVKEWQRLPYVGPYEELGWRK
ncbi:UNVERIFIED_CONTAM: hypothetical protein Slati_0140700 [Sesamum latifolium]|uniref:PORR domain-containing protein n=1 Tax=Sesamum latifolium TaxID=2727402 RepID=A0AAW2YA49_9LAMI